MISVKSKEMGIGKIIGNLMLYLVTRTHDEREKGRRENEKQHHQILCVSVF